MVGISLEHLGGRVHHSFGTGHKWHTADTTWSRNKIGTSTGTIPCSELFEEVASRKGLRLENYGAQGLDGRRLDRNGGGKKSRGPAPPVDGCCCIDHRIFRSVSRRRKLKGGLTGFDLVFPRILTDARVRRHELLVRRHG